MKNALNSHHLHMLRLICQGHLSCFASKWKKKIRQEFSYSCKRRKCKLDGGEIMETRVLTDIVGPKDHKRLCKVLSPGRNGLTVHFPIKKTANLSFPWNIIRSKIKVALSVFIIENTRDRTELFLEQCGAFREISYRWADRRVFISL